MFFPDIKKHKKPSNASAAYILTLRNLCGLTQDEWAEKLGCSKRQVRNYETDGNYPYDTQYMAEMIFRDHKCKQIAIAVLEGGGNKAGVIVAQTLYLQDKALPAEAIRRGIKHTKDNEK